MSENTSRIDALTPTDANQSEKNHDAVSQRDERRPANHASRREFGKLMLAGTGGALGLAGTGAAREQEGWRQGYRQYAQEYVPEFYRNVAKQDNLYRCIQYEAENTNFWQKAGERMYLDQAVVTAAYAYPKPNYKRVDQDSWDGILGDMYADMPQQYKQRREYPIATPVVVAYLYDGYYNAVAYLQPYGDAYKSYGYMIKNGYQDYPDYSSMSDYESNTWWWTEDGMGDASTTEGGILDGVPTGLTE